MSIANLQAELERISVSHRVAQYIQERTTDIRQAFSGPEEFGQAEACRAISLSLARLSERDKALPEVQALYTHLVLYFQSCNDRAYVNSGHSALLRTSRYYNRIRAWLHWRRYTTHQSHITGLPTYLMLLNSDAVRDDEDATADLVQDLQQYLAIIKNDLPSDIYAALEHRLADSTTIDQYPLLRAFAEATSTDSRPLYAVIPYTGQEYAPSAWAHRIFREGFMDRIRERSPGWPDRILGLTAAEARYDAIRCGQADFDKGYKVLMPMDVVAIYCYFNMRKHFFTCLSVFQRTNITAVHDGSKNLPIAMVDIGCGPGTVGLALLEALRESGDPRAVCYYGIDTAVTMQQMATNLIKVPVEQSGGAVLFAKNISDLNIASIPPCTGLLISASYVFASTSLDVHSIADWVTAFKQERKDTSVAFFFQNSTMERLNRKYEEFKKLVSFTKLFSRQETIFYHNTPGQLHNVKSEPVFYEVLALM